MILKIKSLTELLILIYKIIIFYIAMVLLTIIGYKFVLRTVYSLSPLSNPAKKFDHNYVLVF